MALFLLLLLLFSHRIDPSAGNGDHDNHFSTLIVRFSGTQRIRGIASDGANLMVVVVDQSLALYQLGHPSNDRFVPLDKPLWHIPLEGDADDPLTDLRIVLELGLRLIVCTSHFCKSCALILPHMAPDDAQCLFNPLTLRNQQIEVSAMRTVLSPRGRLLVRAIANATTASIHAIDRDGMFTSADPEHVTQHAVVYGFSFGPNAYFVGSARRPILPKKVARNLADDHIAYAPATETMRVTRVCMRDNSVSEKPENASNYAIHSSMFVLRSRMELALDCPHPADDADGAVFATTSVSPTTRALAASITSEARALLVLVERERAGGRGTRQSVCRFDLAALCDAFDRTRDLCRSVGTRAASTLAECRKRQMGPDWCQIFHWSINPIAMPCHKPPPDEQHVQQIAEKCSHDADLHMRSMYGRMENFRPFNGTTVLASLPTSNASVLSIAEAADGNILWLARQDGSIERWAISENVLLSSIHIGGKSPQSMHRLELIMDARHGRLLFKRGNEIRGLLVNCPTLYPTCDAIQWADPLKCRWCAYQNFTGHTMSIGRDPCAGGTVLEQCPPNITEVKLDIATSMLIISGKRMNTFHNLSVLHCSQECASPPVYNSYIIRCQLKRIEQGCRTVRLSGAFGTSTGPALSFVHTIPSVHRPQDKMASVDNDSFKSILHALIWLLLLASPTLCCMFVVPALFKCLERAVRAVINGFRTLRQRMTFGRALRHAIRARMRGTATRNQAELQKAHYARNEQRVKMDINSGTQKKVEEEESDYAYVDPLPLPAEQKTERQMVSGNSVINIPPAPTVPAPCLPPHCG